MREINKIIIGSSIGDIDHINFYKILISKNVVLNVPHFFIKRNGEIIKLIPIDHDSEYMDYDCFGNIGIELESYGILTKNKDKYLDSFGNEINIDNTIKHNIRYSGYWEGINTDQLKSLTELINELCIKYNLSNELPKGYSTKSKYKDIILRLNDSIYYNDLNPILYSEIKKLLNN